MPILVGIEDFPSDRDKDKRAAKKLGGTVDPMDVHVTACPTLAVVRSYEKGENVIGGKPQPVNSGDQLAGLPHSP